MKQWRAPKPLYMVIYIYLPTTHTGTPKTEAKLDNKAEGTVRGLSFHSSHLQQCLKQRS